MIGLTQLVGLWGRSIDYARMKDLLANQHNLHTLAINLTSSTVCLITQNSPEAIPPMRHPGLARWR